MQKLFMSLLVLVCCGSAQADIIAYDNRTTWQHNTTTTSVEDFNSFVTEDGFNIFSFPPVLDLGEFTMTTTSSFGFIDIPGVGFDTPFTNIDGTPLAVMGLADEESLLLNFATPQIAFGADFRDLFNDPTQPTDIFVNGQSVNLPFASPTGTIRFFGFTSTDPFSQVEIRGMSIGDQFGMDNVEFAPVPEPIPVVLFSLVGLWLSVRRRRM